MPLTTSSDFTMPRPPKGLSASARKLWREIHEHLASYDALWLAIGPRVTMYCIAWDRFRAASDYLKEHSFEDPGYLAMSKLFGVASRTMRQCSRELGMTPLSRHRLKRLGVFTAEPIEQPIRRRRISSRATIPFPGNAQP